IMNKIPIYEYETKHGTKYGFRFYGGQDTNKDYSKTIQKRGFKDFDSALSAYLDTKKAFENGQLKPRPKRYMFKDVYDLWFQQHNQDIKPSTAYNIKILFDNYILPELGNRYMDKITPAICQKAINQWSKDYPKFIKLLVSRSGQVFDYAYRLELVSSNPVKRVIMPRSKSSDAKDKYYTKQELGQFLDCCKKECDLKYYAAFRLLAYSGMRKGELLALTWNDIDFSNNTISINKTVSRNENGHTIVQTTKTKKSMRVISMDSQTMAIIRQWQLKQRKALLALGYNAINGNQIVFQGRNNKYLSKVTLNRIFRKIQTRNKLKIIPIHGLRHTHCSLLLAAGVPVN
ncbi:site-specific integrase, partial [Limosilactobacillus mucosae]|nr:site-specific integrase [Limosilactobacillus mucosae]